MNRQLDREIVLFSHPQRLTISPQELGAAVIESGNKSGLIHFNKLCMRFSLNLMRSNN